MAKVILQEKILPILVVVLIGAVFALGMLWGKLQVYEKTGGKSSVAGTQAAGTPAPAAPPENVTLSADQWQQILNNPAASRGEDSAPVTMVEFTDYQCPYCSRHFSQTDPQIQEKYIKTGQVRYLVRDLPLAFHPNAKPAALAARCAGDQEKYWEMHDALFGRQDQWSALADATDTFKGYAQELGLNSTQFNSCFDTGKYNVAIDADSALATKIGATGTPTFFINAKMVVGAQPLSAFETAIDEALQ
ncbi:hypothetical protein A3A66_03245 [Microgenomates group bacterium RIFCSPLOWO2_01_FULL_46_13]|nr:MAG: hypothetical protein A3A66_03245 [Microgenomates group bacterium RIFCSPLOWO2_01_FULL_46_13]